MIAAAGAGHHPPPACVLAHLALDIFATFLERGKRSRRCKLVQFVATTSCYSHLTDFVFSHIISNLPNFRVQKYIEALTSKTKPKKILVCMIYYPDEKNVPSWANAALGALGYDQNPGKIQLLIRKFFEEATR